MLARSGFYCMFWPERITELDDSFLLLAFSYGSYFEANHERFDNSSFHLLVVCCLNVFNAAGEAMQKLLRVGESGFGVRNCTKLGIDGRVPTTKGVGLVLHSVKLSGRLVQIDHAPSSQCHDSIALGGLFSQHLGQGDPFSFE